MELYNATQRVKDLRKEYLTNSPMAVGEGRERHHDYPNYGTRCLLFTEGWLKNKNAGNTKMRFSAATAYQIENTLPVITPGELIVGQPDMDWTSRYTPEQREELKHIYYDIARTPFFNREGHIALDYTKLLEKGIEGMIEEIDGYMSALDLRDGRDVSKYEFYVCAKNELTALLKLEDRYVEAAGKLADLSQGKEKEEYLELKSVIDRVPRKRATTFREALQSIHFYTFPMQGLFSFGRVDDFLYPYYRHDIDNGLLTEEKAQELIDCFCLLFAATVPPWAAAGFMLGGLDRQGKPVENELTWLFLNGISHTHLPDPGVGLCVTEHTSEEILKFASGLLSQGESHPAIWNDKIVTQNLIKLGVKPEDARQYTHSTCVEVTPIGCANWQITSPYVNTLQAFLDAFEDFGETDTLDEMIDKFEKSLNKMFGEMMINVHLGLHEKARNGMVDPTIVSCLVRDCLAAGKFKEDCGAVYNRLACNFLGISNVVESFHIINKLVLEEKSITLFELRNAVKCNYSGFEALLQKIRSRVTHFGNNEPDSDLLAKRIADICVKCAESHRDIYGNLIIPGAFSYDSHVEIGSKTKASPDGRMDFDALHDGSNPVQGYDVTGPTAMLNSVSAWNPSRFSGGIATNVKLSGNREHLSDTVFRLINGFVKLDIPEMQISVASKQDMEQAQKTPEKYGDLLVRIGGYSDFFVKLDRRVQDELIRRSENH